MIGILLFPLSTQNPLKFGQFENSYSANDIQSIDGKLSTLNVDRLAAFENGGNKIAWKTIKVTTHLCSTRHRINTIE